jgi:hypothetical protein
MLPYYLCLSKAGPPTVSPRAARRLGVPAPKREKVDSASLGINPRQRSGSIQGP